MIKQLETYLFIFLAIIQANVLYGNYRIAIGLGKTPINNSPEMSRNISASSNYLEFETDIQPDSVDFKLYSYSISLYTGYWNKREHINIKFGIHNKKYEYKGVNCGIRANLWFTKTILNKSNIVPGLFIGYGIHNVWSNFISADYENPYNKDEKFNNGSFELGANLLWTINHYFSIKAMIMQYSINYEEEFFYNSEYYRLFTVSVGYSL